jgi:hypothetical protein
MITIEDQEDLMHMIHDVLRIGVSVSSLEFRIKYLCDKYDHKNIKEILNTPMKDEKYSNEMVLPLTKVLYIDTNDEIKEYYAKKLLVLKIFENYGVDFSIINEKMPNTLPSITQYSMFYLFAKSDCRDENPSLVDLLLKNKLIDNKIKEFLSRFIKQTINIVI